MRDVSEVRERIFRESDSDPNFGASPTKYLERNEMAGIAERSPMSTWKL